MRLRRLLFISLVSSVGGSAVALNGSTMVPPPCSITTAQAVVQPSLWVHQGIAAAQRKSVTHLLRSSWEIPMWGAVAVLAGVHFQPFKESPWIMLAAIVPFRPIISFEADTVLWIINQLSNDQIKAFFNEDDAQKLLAVREEHTSFSTYAEFCQAMQAQYSSWGPFERVLTRLMSLKNDVGPLPKARPPVSSKQSTPQEKERPKGSHKRLTAEQLRWLNKVPDDQLRVVLPRSTFLIVQQIRQSVTEITSDESLRKKLRILLVGEDSPVTPVIRHLRLGYDLHLKGKIYHYSRIDAAHERVASWVEQSSLEQLAKWLEYDDYILVAAAKSRGPIQSYTAFMAAIRLVNTGSDFHLRYLVRNLTTAMKRERLAKSKAQENSSSRRAA